MTHAPKRPDRKHEITVFGFLLLVAAVVFSAYRLGLPGDFMFDDYPNLQTLSAHGGVTDLDSLKLYLGDAFAGPTGRPISMLSFLIDVREWPADPGAIKYKNILIHLLNGLLLAWVLIQALRQSRVFGNGNRILWIAGISAAAWMAHPLHVSTVLYAIQRMAELSTLFVLLGLGSYLWGRSKLGSRPRFAYTVMGISLFLGTVLATYSKENGALLPLLAMVVEATLLARDQAHRPDWRFQAAFLWAPSAALVVYVGSHFFTAGAGSQIMNGYSPLERVLTESRILFDYLFSIVVPQSHTAGIFRDSIEISRGLLSPATTFWAVLGLAGLAALTIVMRHRAPLLSAAIAFFLAAHLIESTAIMLELHFEHRNYLPSLLLFLPLAQLVTIGFERTRKPAAAASVALLIGLTAVTATRADLWSNRTELYLLWASENPESPRAQLSAANVLQHADRREQAAALIGDALDNHPDHLGLNIYLARIQQGAERLAPTQLLQLQDAARSSGFSKEALNALRQLTDAVIGKEDGRRGEMNGILKIWGALERNPAYTAKNSLKAQIAHQQGRILAYLGKGAEAEQHFAHAMKLAPATETGFMQAAILATNGFFCKALSQLEATKPLLSKDPKIAGREGYYRKEFKRLREVMEEDARQAGHSCEQRH